MPDPIPIEPFEPGPKPTLGPASIAEAMRPLEAIGGEAVIVFIRDNVDSSDVAIPLVPLPAADLVRILPALIADRAGLTLVSDGNMSHAVSVNEERGGRPLPELDGLWVSAGDKKLLDGVSLAIERGDLIICEMHPKTGGYFTHVERTFCLGEPEAKQIEIYEGCVAASPS